MRRIQARLCQRAHVQIMKRLCGNSIAKTGGAVKNRAMNRMKIFAILIGALLAAVPVRGQDDVEAIVAQKVQPILPRNGKGGGVVVAVRMNGETRFFNYGFANDARNERVTADSIFNLGSVGKLFATTTLAEAVKGGQLSLGRSGCQICH
jgi:Beta-lactamase